MSTWITWKKSHTRGNHSFLNKYYRIINNSIKLIKSYIIASNKFSVLIKNNKNIEGPISPIHVIKRLTDKTDHLLTIKESAKWPLIIPNNEFIIYGTAANDRALDDTLKFFDRYVGSLSC